MARNNKIDLPNSGGGLTQNYGSTGSIVLIDPRHLVIGIVAFVAIIVLFGYL